MHVKHLISQIEQDDARTSKYPDKQGHLSKLLILNLSELQVTHYYAEELHVKHVKSHKEQRAVESSKYPSMQVQVFATFIALNLAESQLSH